MAPGAGLAAAAGAAAPRPLGLGLLDLGGRVVLQLDVEVGQVLVEVDVHVDLVVDLRLVALLGGAALAAARRPGPRPS